MITLAAKQAAEYVGCRSVAQFRREVAQGIWPQPIAPRSRPQRWSKIQLIEAQRGKTGQAKQPDKTFSGIEAKLGL